MRGVFRALLVSALATSAAVAAAESSEARQERGKWRVSVGASVIGPVKSDLGISNARMRQLSGFGSSLIQSAAARHGVRPRAEAYAAGSGAVDPNGVRRFDGGAWYDPRDAASANDPDWSWNWRLHDPTGTDPDGRKGFVEYTSYSEDFESVALTTLGDGAGYDRDSSEWFPGLRVELARELYCREGERPWGVDIAAAFAYYFQRGLWKADGTAATAEVEGHREAGHYEWWNDSEDTAQYVLDYERDTQFQGGMWGAGTFGGPGAELETAAWKVRDVMTDDTKSWSSSHALRYHGSGDYREYSIELLARPWWEPWEWLRVFGSIGVEVSRREFEWKLTATGSDGSRFSESGEASDWAVFGLLGGGLALQWHDFILAGEALWRFGGDDLTVSGQTVNGRIESGEWGFRLSLGYRF